MSGTPTMTTTDAVLRVRTGDDVVTAIERFGPDATGREDDMSTLTREPPATPHTVHQPIVARAADHLHTTLRATPGFVAGLLLDGHDGELVLYSQWRTAGPAPHRIPDAWSLAPAAEDLVLVDARTYAVDFVAPGPVTEVSPAATPHAHFGVFTVSPASQRRLLELARTPAPASIGTPGLRAINFHRSLDGRRVINLGLSTGFDEFAALLSRPGFTGGAEYWTDVAGFRPHYFDVAAITTEEQP